MYKDMIVKVLIFAVGAVMGGTATLKYAKDKYEKIANEEIAQMREYWKKKEEETIKTRGIVKSEVNDDEKEVPNASHEECEKEEEKEDKEEMHKPEVVAPEETWEKDYPTISLTYYEGDQTLTDDQDRIIKNVDELVGEDFASHFGEYEDDSVFIRNDNLCVYYEILRDYGSYSDYMREE